MCPCPDIAPARRFLPGLPPPSPPGRTDGAGQMAPAPPRGPAGSARLGSAWPDSAWPGSAAPSPLAVPHPRRPDGWAAAAAPKVLFGPSLLTWCSKGQSSEKMTPTSSKCGSPTYSAGRKSCTTSFTRTLLNRFLRHLVWTEHKDAPYALQSDSQPETVAQMLRVQLPSTGKVTD